ncbi:Type I Iterative PKS [Clathrus columnatus]|uniref:Type I Iterative PKS n=1 Tax=Clathrus columnatus TaxID=1419009 RepID=A0AAV5ARE0_9AGAM|nr:Type I Iterative PKS [Clathrus columnatus]
MSPEPVAIIGVSAELPSGGALNLDFDSFWPFLLRGGEAYSPIPQDRFNHENFSYLITPRTGTFLSQPTLHDPLEFGISGSDAALLPVSVRKLLEHSFLALRDSGINYRGANVGVYTAGAIQEVNMFSGGDPHTIMGSSYMLPSAISDKISYHLDLRGPSFPVDTACSSTLTATHLAVQALRNGECESALVGGAQINLRIDEWIQYSQMSVLSKDGKCKPFDASADGFARGEGVACIVLKPLNAALRDGDHVYATILGSAINATGHQGPLNAPVATAQQDAMLRAYKRAGRVPDEVDFVEMHATGTAVGDPTETNWVGETFKHKDHSPLLVGGVKGNMGHLEITSFLASLLKVIHVVEHNTIPPTVNFAVPNPSIKWKEYNLQVPITPVPFTPRADSHKALASISSFGIGGANGHVIVEGLERSRTAKTQTFQHSSEQDDAILIMSGGLSPRSSAVMADLLKEAFSYTPKESLPFLAKLASRQSRQLTWRSYALYHPAAKPLKPITFPNPELVPHVAPRLVFVFNGQGSQHALMGYQLFSKYPIFRRSVYECDKAFHAVTGSSLLKDYGFFSGPAISDQIHWHTNISLPLLTTFQIALFDLLCSFGIKPDAVVSHSAGESAVLYTSGAGSKEMAVQLSFARGQMMMKAENTGSMAAVACGEVEAQALIDEVLKEEGISDNSVQPQNLVISCYNSPEGFAVTGLTHLIDRLCALASSRDIRASRLHINVPGHSHLMDICEEQCMTLVGDVFKRFPEAGKPLVATYSTVTGEKWEEPYSADYYWRNTRQPVLFNQVISQLVKQNPNMCYIEISPHPALSSHIPPAGVPISKVTCPSRRPTRTGEFMENTAFLESLGQLAMNGIDIDFAALNGFPAWEPDIRLPAYPFNKKDIPFHLQSSAFDRLVEVHKGPLNHLRLRLGTKTHPLLAGHVINSEPIMPAAGFIEMALEFGARTLSNVEFLTALSLPSDVPATVEVAVDGVEWTVKTSSSRELPVFNRLHSRGILTYEPDETDETPLDLTSIKSRCSQSCRIDNIYEHGFKGYADYSNEFRRINSCIQGEDELFATFRGSVGLPGCHKYVFDPVILDAVFHGCIFFIMQNEPVFLNYETRDYYLPSRVARVVAHNVLVVSGLPDQIAAHFILKDWTPDRLTVDIFITNLAGERLCSLYLFDMTRHSNHTPQPVKHCYHIEWLPVALPPADLKDQYYVLELTNNARDLYTVLDGLAAQTIARTMKGQVVVGTERHRQRYWEFAKKVVERIESYPAPDPFLVDSLKSRYPSYFDLTERVAKVHADIFTSHTAAVNALYSDDKSMRGLSNPMQLSFREPEKLFRNLLQQFSLAGKKVIRVLEVGCGNGMLTEHLINVLPDFPDLVLEYFASDISFDLAYRIAGGFQYPYMRAIAYDLNEPFGEQELLPTSFDIITAFSVLHATRNLSQTMNSIRDLLVPGGYTLVIELDGVAWECSAPGTLWYDFLFGGFEEWFDFDDDRVSHCTIPLQRWHQLLQSAGFDWVTSSSTHPDEDHTFVFLGQKIDDTRYIFPEEFDDEQPLKDIDICISDPVFTYQYGNEMDIRDGLAKLDTSAKMTIWIIATEGLDGTSAHGLVQTLIQELIVWTFHLVIFDESWSISKRMVAISKLLKKPPHESEIKINLHGEMYVPRVVPLLASPFDTTFNDSLPWARIDGQTVQISSPLHREGDIDVHVIYWSSTDDSYSKAFLGTVASDGSAKFLKGSWVMGVTVGPLTNPVVTNAGSVIPSGVHHNSILADIPGIVVAALALDLNILTRFGRLGTINRVLVTDVHTKIGFAIARFCLTLGLDTFCIGEDDDATKLCGKLHVPVSQISVASNAVWVAQQRGTYDVILSGAQTKASSQTIKQLASPGGIIYLWNSSSQSLSSRLETDWWSVTLALEAALQVLPKDFASSSLSTHVDDIISHTPASVPQRMQLFDSTKVYVLIGGVGGIGIRMTPWMYENGARHIVLTSRNGRETLRRTGQVDSLRILKYLEQLPDLHLQVKAVDAASYEATNELLGSLKKPLGGCFLMSLIISDNVFLNETKDNFSRVSAAKTEAFRILERCIDISRLDFFVIFSSVAALFGHAGQSTYSTSLAATGHMISKYPNAFSLIVPGITDGGRLARDYRDGGRLIDWGLTTRELCDYLGDGLRKLRHGSFGQYIPELNWNLVRRDMGSMMIFQHLCTTIKKVDVEKHAESGDGVDLENLVRTTLDVPAEEFLPNVPFTAYGLDSLTAVRLSAEILAATGVKATQMQLLADMTLEELIRKTSQTTMKHDEE